MMESFNISDLTDEEIRILQNTTPEQWADVATECIKDPSFWSEIASAFIDGFVRGLTQE